MLTVMSINNYRRKSHRATCQTELERSLKHSCGEGAFYMAGHLLLSTHWAHVFDLQCCVTCLVSYHVMQTVIPQSSISCSCGKTNCGATDVSEVQIEEQDTELRGKKHGKFPEMIPYAFCTWFQWLMSREHSDLVHLKSKGTVLYTSKLRLIERTLCTFLKKCPALPHSVGEQLAKIQDEVKSCESVCAYFKIHCDLHHKIHQCMLLISECFEFYFSW